MKSSFKSAFKSSSKPILWALLTPLLMATGVMGLGALSHCSKTDNQVDDGCANACTASQVCSKGSCKTTCDSGLTICGSSCVDVAQDAANCGACGHVCTANQVCTASSCTFQISAAQIQTTAVSQVTRPKDKIEGSIHVQRTAQDSQGNVYITGDFKGTMRLGDKTISCQTKSQDVFVAKIGLNGQVIWAKSFENQNDATFQSSGTAIAVDAKGNVYVGGYFTGIISFGVVGGLSVMLQSSILNPGTPSAHYTQDAFLTKLDSDGTVVWAFKYGEETGDYADTIEAVTVDQQGSVIAMARYLESGAFTWAVMKYAADTTTMETWKVKWKATTTYFDGSVKLVTDAQSNIVVLLNKFTQEIGTGDFQFPKIVAAKDENNQFIRSNSLVKMARDTGVIQWVSSLPYDYRDQINLLMSQGSLVVMDRFTQALNFGTDHTSNYIKIPAPLGNRQDIYWSTWNLTTGKPINAHALEGSGERSFYTYDTSIDSQGNIWMTSVFTNQASYGSTVLQPMNDSNIALVKLDATGKPLWAERLNDGFVPYPQILRLVLDAQNSPWLLLYVDAPTSIGGTKLTIKGGLFDFGFAKLKP